MTAIASKPAGAAESPANTSKGGEPRRLLLRRVRQGLFAVLLLGLAALAALALRPQRVVVDVARVTRGPLVVAIQETGVTRVKDRFAVSAPVSGMLSRVSLEAGDPVREGDLLAEIAPTLSPLLDERAGAQARARLAAALSALGQARAQSERAATAQRQAERDLQRVRKLAAARTIAEQTLEEAEFGAQMRTQEVASAEFAVKVAAEEVRSARAVLGMEGGARSTGRHVDVLAPASGTVLRIDRKSAGVVQAGTPLLEVGDARALEVVIDLLTTDAVRVRPGTRATVGGWGGERQLHARVRRIEPSGFTRPSALGVDEQRVNVILAFTEPPERWAMLADNFRVEARIVVWKASSVLKLPNGAVFRYGDGWGAYSIEDDRSWLRRVRVGHRGEAEAEILAGLPEGAMVVVHPGDRVIDGARVVAH